MKQRFVLAIFLAIFASLISVSPAACQRGFGAKPAPGGGGGPHGSFGVAGRGTFGFAHPVYPVYRRRAGGWGWRPAWGQGWGWGYLPFPDYYDYPSEYEPGMTEAQYEPAEAPPRERVSPEKSIEPLLLEKQGDEWVKVSGYRESPAAVPVAGEATRTHAVMQSSNEEPKPPREVPSTVLVFRDGHEEEINNYTIIGNNIFVKTNYWTSGSWTKQIQISNLDVPATLKRNQERGSNFTLPSGPYEVEMRF